MQSPPGDPEICYLLLFPVAILRQSHRHRAGSDEGCLGLLSALGYAPPGLILLLP